MITKKKTRSRTSSLKLKPLKRVLIALDYNPTAKKVAETGYSFAKTMDADVILIHVVSEAVYYTALEYSPIMGYSGFTDSDLKINTGGLIKASEQFLEKSKQHLGDENIKTLVAEGEFAEAILKAAKDLNADLIVMGSHSRRWLEKILVGSVTQQVLKNTTVPLIIVPTKE